MSITVDGLIFIAKLLLLSGLFGFFFTLGVWGFCKAFRWAPVNLTVNNYPAALSHSDDR